jgi:hypothetical protein
MDRSITLRPTIVMNMVRMELDDGYQATALLPRCEFQGRLVPCLEVVPSSWFP